MRHASGPIGYGRAAIVIAAGLGVAALVVAMAGRGHTPAQKQIPPADVTLASDHDSGKPRDKIGAAAIGLRPTEVRVRPPAEFVAKGVAWLVKAQHVDGGWGAGSHANQQNRDPHAVKVDPATTAFAASALLRYGNTPTEGEYRDNVRRATEYLCTTVDEYSKEGPKITDLAGTQIQSKLGPLVDTAMTAQYLARVLPSVPTSDPLRKRVDHALEKCISKLQLSQQKDGSWNVGGGWASVLQSSLGCSALEYAQAAGKPIDRDRLAQAQRYQLGNFDVRSGQVRTEASAGVTLYAYNGSLRGNVAKSRAADDFIASAKESGKLAVDAPVSVENLKKAGVAEKQAEELFAANSNVTSQVATLNGISRPTALAGAPVSSTPGGAPSSVAEETAAVSTGSLMPARPLPAPVPLVALGDSPVAGPVITSPTSTYEATDRTALSIAGAVRAGSRSAGPASGAAPTVTDDEALLRGFGNNGGEEFLSYMLASESMVISGEKDWAPWYDKMSGRLAKVQSPDGSWTGHHCITSPVFCTAAVVQTMTADRDAPLLARLAQDAAALAKVEEPKK